MRHELIICWSKAGGSFIVEVPELPGCMADGASHEEAAATAQAVIGILSRHHLGPPAK